jgi:RHS repeat-associated protein
LVPTQGLVVTTIDYTYDYLSRLTQADYSSGEGFQYAYDAVGNMTALTATITNTVVTTKAYDAANHLIAVTSDGAVRTLDWSAAGELLRDGDDTYTWDAVGRLASATVDGVTSRYAYLGDGGRISMTVGSETTTYTLDLAALLVQVLVANQSTNPQSTTYLYSFTRIGEFDGEWHYHLADHLGSVRSLVGADGGVEGTRAYRPYGVQLSSAGTASSIYGFTGEQTDQPGLIYLRARMYAPEIGRFISQDTITPEFSQPQSLNLYAYVRGNPTNYIDPSGHRGTAVIIVSKHSHWTDWHSWAVASPLTDRYRVGTERDKDDNITKHGVERLAEILEWYTDCIGILTLSGHGSGGAGISVEDHYRTYIDQRIDPALATRIANKLCKNATVNVCACGGGKDEAKMQRLANKLQAEVCACTGTLWYPCICRKKWHCVWPNSVDDEILKEREKCPDIPKKKR